MKRLFSIPRLTPSLFCLASLALGLLGCAAPRVDWDARVGNYTYDQVVLDLGPADKSETLKDGTKVAEWLTARGYSRGTLTSLGGQYYGTPWVHYYSEQPSQDSLIRLTFSPDGVLRAWRKALR